jgi:N-acetylglutamate synthase-like GNAT family acetyltransferase
MPIEFAIGPRHREACKDLLRQCNMGTFLAPLTVGMFSHAKFCTATGGIDFYDGFAWISAVAVNDLDRRQGHGSTIINALLDIARLEGVKEVWLETMFWNKKFYEPLGFELIRIGDVPPNIKQRRRVSRCCFFVFKL